MYSFVLCVRDKESSVDEFGSGFGSVSYLQIPTNNDLSIQPRTVPRPSNKVSGLKEWLGNIVSQAMPDNVPPGNGLDIVFFVHGYNTSPEEALTRQRLVEKNLKERGFQCMVIGFDWPTGGTPALYEYDRFEAQKAASLLVEGGILPFVNFTVKNCPINVHLMAHSMGAFVVREAFRAVDKGHSSDLANDWRIGQLVLFGADISSDCFELGDKDMAPVFNHCGRLTNYFSGYDEALAVSNLKNIDISSRVGRIGMPKDSQANNKAVDVNCGPRYKAIDEDTRKQFKYINGMVSHSWYLEDQIWNDDLAYTLKGQLDRYLIPTRSRVENNDNDFVLNSKS